MFLYTDPREGKGATISITHVDNLWLFGITIIPLGLHVLLDSNHVNIFIHT